MKTLLNSLAFLALILLAASCHKVRVDGPVRTETRAERNFNAIRSDIPADITYTEGSDYRVEISAQQALLDHIETRVDGGELKFYFSGAYNFTRNDGISIRVTAPGLVSAYVNGSGEIHGEALDLSEKPFSARVSGSGKIDFPAVYCSELSTKISGSGSIRISGGSAATATHEIDGSGSIDTRNLRTVDTRVDISGSGTMHVWATGTLDANISGSGNVYYRGNPRVSSSISGSGKVRGE